MRAYKKEIIYILILISIIGIILLATHGKYKPIINGNIFIGIREGIVR